MWEQIVLLDLQLMEPLTRTKQWRSAMFIMTCFLMMEYQFLQGNKFV